MTGAATPTEPGPAQRRGQAGTTVVEFALILVVFFTLVFSVFDFSIYMNSREAVRNGIREAGRIAVVNRVPSSTCSTNPSPLPSPATTADTNLVCLVKSRIGQAATNTWIWISWPDPDGGSAAGNHLRICAIYATNSTTGLTAPFIPKRVTSEVTLLMEQPFPDNNSVQEKPSLDWSFCS